MVEPGLRSRIRPASVREIVAQLGAGLLVFWFVFSPVAPAFAEESPINSPEVVETAPSPAPEPPGATFGGRGADKLSIV